MHARPSWPRGLVVLLVAVLCPRSSLAADPKEEARELSEKVKAAFQREDYEEAVTLSERVFSTYKHRNALWNLARAHQLRGRQLRAQGDLSRARHHLNESRTRFDMLAQLSESDFDEARGQVTVLDTELAELDARIAAPIAADPPPEPISEPVVVSLGPTLPVVERREEGDALVVPGILVTSAGAVLAGLGIFFLVDAEDTRATVRDAADESGLVTTVTQSRARALEDEADTSAALGVAGVAVGGAAIVTGTILLLIGDGPSTQQGTTMTLRTTGRDASLVLMGSF